MPPLMPANGNQAELTRSRDEVKRKALDLGAEEALADRVAEAAIRRAQAQDEGRLFLYVDIEHQLEDLYRERNASPERIANAKHTVWEAARELSAERGVQLEEALFFCFHAAVVAVNELDDGVTAGLNAESQQGESARSAA
jgi:hypothetical protein